MHTRNLRIAERYVKGELRILVETRSKVFLTNPPKFCSVLERERPIEGYRHEDVWIAKDVSGAKVMPDVNGDAFVSCPNYKQESVFVYVTEDVQSPKVFIPSTVRFETIDRVYGSLRHSLHFSRAFGLVFLESLSNRKRSDANPRSSSVSQH